MDLHTATQVALVVLTGVLSVATLWLAKEAGRHSREMKLARELEEKKQEIERTPYLEAWLQQPDNDLLRGDIAYLMLIVGNVGEAAARNIRWWFKDVDEEQWKKREIGGVWPSNREKSGGQRILPGGGRIPVVMVGGRNLHTEPGKPDHQREEIKAFSIVLEYSDIDGSEKWKREIRLDPSSLYRSGGRGPASPLHDIAAILRRAFDVSGPSYARDPLHGLSAQRVEELRETANIMQGDGSFTRVANEQSEWLVGGKGSQKQDE